MKTDTERYAENAKNLLLSTFTTQELLNELVKRGGVEIIDVPEDRKWYTTVTDDDGYGEEAGKGWGEATIIVVRGKE